MSAINKILEKGWYSRSAIEVCIAHKYEYTTIDEGLEESEDASI